MIYMAAAESTRVDRQTLSGLVSQRSLLSSGASKSAPQVLFSGIYRERGSLSSAQMRVSWLAKCTRLPPPVASRCFSDEAVDFSKECLMRRQGLEGVVAALGEGRVR